MIDQATYRASDHILVIWSTICCEETSMGIIRERSVFDFFGYQRTALIPTSWLPSLLSLEVSHSGNLCPALGFVSTMNTFTRILNRVPEISKTIGKLVPPCTPRTDSTCANRTKQWQIALTLFPHLARHFSHHQQRWLCVVFALTALTFEVVLGFLLALTHPCL